MSRAARLLSLHHVTATVDRAQPDLDFCERLLGLRLVKRTVNFDNHNVYHFYYGTETGAPGTIWTTFPYHGWGVPVGVIGAGTDRRDRVLGARRRARASGGSGCTPAGVAPRGGAPRFGEPPAGDPRSLRPRDRAGPVPDTRGRRGPAGAWTSDGVRGLHSVTLLLRDARPARSALMTGLLGFETVDESPASARASAAAAPRPATWWTWSRTPRRRRRGTGSAPSITWPSRSGARRSSSRSGAELIEEACRVTEVRDRTYFQSIYFREPGGVLFEVATMAPGFAVDEPRRPLGRALRLPPWEEPHRGAIEATLPRLDR